MLDNKRKKELRVLYEMKIGKEYVKGLENEPFVSITEFVDLKTGSEAK